MKRLIAILLCTSLLCAVAPAQSVYKAPPVTVSKQKVKNNGRVYYSHVVLERQTLFSIAKAYGVTIEDIYEANKALDLRKAGLKKNQIIMIPLVQAHTEVPRPEASHAETHVEKTHVEEPEVQSHDTPAKEVKPEIEYTVHVVKWYEDLYSIARKYGVSERSIMLFNKLSSKKLSRRQELKIPKVEIEEESPEQSQALADTVKAIEFVGKKSLSAALVLPFNEDSESNENMYDFYCGALLALKNLKDEGINVILYTFNTDSPRYYHYDLVLGPVSKSDISRELERCPGSIKLVSPLDSRNAELAGTKQNFVQAPPPSELYSSDLVNWIASERVSSDSIYVFVDKDSEFPESGKKLIAELDEAQMQYHIVKYGILEGRTKIENMMESGSFSRNGANRILIASEDQAFVQEIIRNANILQFNQINTVLYCTSKVRTFDTIEIEHLHNTNARMSLGYYIDYDNPKVQAFLLAYRALFNTEPNQYAFVGYDTAYTLLKACSDYGDKWEDLLCRERRRGLQSDFLFKHIPGGGYVNQAVRRIVHEPGYITRLL